MKNIRNTEESLLFDRTLVNVGPQARKLLLGGWQHVVRVAIIDLLPAPELGEHFSADLGRPTKELYSVCGLMLLKEYFGWSVPESLEHYMLDLGVQYALNLQADHPEMSAATFFRYQDLLRKNNLAQTIMHDVTEAVLKKLNQNITEQRLDSTHVFSNMAVFTRRRLLFEVIRTFLVQVKRHEKSEYEALGPELRARYEKKNTWIFASTANMLDENLPEKTPEKQLCFDLLFLVDRFSRRESCTNMTSYKNMVRVLNEQCEGEWKEVKLRKHPGGKILVNPSDPEAEIGHKGAGYQVQVAETCSKENDVQVVTAIMPEGASAADEPALPKMIDKLQNEGNKPETMYADAGYGSNANANYASHNGVDLIAPAKGKSQNAETALEQCTFDADGRLTACPAGKTPCSCTYNRDKGKWRALFEVKTCTQCRMFGKCAINKGGNMYAFDYDDNRLQLYQRRMEEKTPEFKENYKKRSGIEATFGRLKQNTPLKRLRIRGRQAVEYALHLLFAMHNVMQYVLKLQNDKKKKPKNENGKWENASYGPLWLLLKPFKSFLRTVMPKSCVGAMRQAVA